MRETDIKALPGKKMGDTGFLCLASLTTSGLARLYDTGSRSIIFDYSFRGDTMLLRRKVFESFIAKAWISPSPMHEHHFFITDAGRRALMDEAKARLVSLEAVMGFPCDYRDSFNYNVTFTALECLHLLDRSAIRKIDGVTLDERGRMVLDGIDLLAPETTLRCGQAPYRTFEQHWKSHYDPEGYAADEKARKAAEEADHEARRIASEAQASAASVRLTIAHARLKKREKRERVIETLREDIIRLAKECLLQKASHDDLMVMTERLLRAEDEARNEDPPLAA